MLRCKLPLQYNLHASSQALTSQSVVPLVILPAHNEDQTIGLLVDEIVTRVGWPVVVVDDASSDQTAATAARAGAHVISLAVRLGAWGSVQTGIHYAGSRGFDYVVTMDADGQHDVMSLASVFQPVATGSTDVAIGACPQRVSGLKRFTWHLFRSITGLKIEDLTSGLRAYNRKSLDVLESPEATLLEYQDIGVLLLLRFAGCSITEVAVDMQPRRNGRSRVFPTFASVLYYVMYTLLICVGKRKAQ